MQGKNLHSSAGMQFQVNSTCTDMSCLEQYRLVGFLPLLETVATTGLSGKQVRAHMPLLSSSKKLQPFGLLSRIAAFSGPALLAPSIDDLVCKAHPNSDLSLSH